MEKLSSVGSLTEKEIENFKNEILSNKNLINDKNS